MSAITQTDKTTWMLNTNKEIETIKRLVNAAADNTTKIVIEASNKAYSNIEAGIIDSGLSKNQGLIKKEDVYHADLDSVVGNIKSLDMKESDECIIERDLKSLDKSNQSDEFIKKINESGSAGSAGSAGYTNYCTTSYSQTGYLSKYCESSMSNITFTTSKPDTIIIPISFRSREETNMAGNTTNSSMEFDIESQEWREKSLVESDRKSIEPTEFNESSGRYIESQTEYSNVNNTTRETGIVEEIDSTPPIIKLAKAFKRWLDAIKSDCESPSELESIQEEIQQNDGRMMCL
jgi:hypothetical protein